MTGRSGPREALWDRSSDETRADLARALARGGRIVSLTTYGTPTDPRHATVWSFDLPLEQRLVTDVAASRVGAVVARHARDGFFPALVSMHGPPDGVVLAVVLERAPGGATPPVFLGPRPFRDDRGELFLADACRGAAGDALLLRSVAAAGDVRGARGEQLLVAAVLWPQPSTRIAWAVHLDDDAGAWRDAASFRTLETVARPVVALPLPARDAPSVLSVWHDEVLEPWPAPDPLARAARVVLDEARSPEELGEVVARRGAEGRRVLGLGACTRAGETRFLVQLGAVLRDEPLPRRFVVRQRAAAVEPRDGGAPDGDVIEACTDAGEQPPEPSHPLDRWVRDHMARIGARHGQLVVVRGRRIALARAYTFAEQGYPVASLDHAMRLGSVSKMLTAIPLLEAAVRGSLPGGLDAPVIGPALLDLAAGEGPPRLAAVTLRQLLVHGAGLSTSLHVRPDDPAHPLAEDRLAGLLGRAGPLPPGQLRAALATMRDDAIFTPRPGDGALDYSNEGFILLGEILGRLVCGRFDAYEEAMIAALLRPVGVEPGARGCLFAGGRAGARARRESPAHPSSPTWAPARFHGEDDEGDRVLASYADNGPFLGGAAGWSVPLLWIARVLAGLVPGPGALWSRAAAELAATRPTPGARHGHGVFVEAPCWWRSRPEGGGAPLSHRVRRLHHNGRLEGASSLLVHQMPLDHDAHAEAATLGIALAFDRLGPLYLEPHGREILAIVQAMETAGSWEAAEAFDCLPVG